MNELRKFAMICLLGAGLAGCSSLSSMGRLGGGETADFAAASALSPRLSPADRDALARAVAVAMETGQNQQWRGARAVGVVMPKGYSLANLKADAHARVALARQDLDIAHRMETDLGLYVLTRNTNVRTGPGTDYKVAEVLPSGAGVDVVGRVTDRPWFLIAVNDRVRGYVHQNLAIKAPGTELELAGGPQREPIRCREFDQRIRIFSETDEWESAACYDGAAWRPAREPANIDRSDDDELLGL